MAAAEPARGRSVVCKVIGAVDEDASVDVAQERVNEIGPLEDELYD